MVHYDITAVTYKQAPFPVGLNMISFQLLIKLEFYKNDF